MPMYDKLVKFLKEKSTPYRELQHVAEGSCEKVSAIRGNAVSQAMKAMVLQAKLNKKTSQYYLAVVPGDRGVDMNAIKSLAKAENVRFADAKQATELTECEMGTVPPFSFNDKLTLIVDPAVRQNSEIVFNAGKLDVSFFMSMADYFKVANAKEHVISKILSTSATASVSPIVTAASSAAAPAASAAAAITTPPAEKKDEKSLPKLTM